MGVNRALFLDRDGTIVYDRGYMREPGALELIPGAAAALKALAGEGWKLIVVSNQAGIGRGLIAAAEAEAVQTAFLAMMQDASVPLTGSYICAHAPWERCECRKPSPFFLQKAAREFSLDLALSWMMGDRESDILCGRNAGCSTIWLRNETFPVDPGLPDFIAGDWQSARVRLHREQA